MVLCWIARPTTPCSKLTCDTKLHIDKDETHADVTVQLDQSGYVLTNDNACGIIDYTLSTSLKTDASADPNDLTSWDTDYDLFASGKAVFSQADMKVKFSDF